VHRRHICVAEIAQPWNDHDLQSLHDDHYINGPQFNDFDFYDVLDADIVNQHVTNNDVGNENGRQWMSTRFEVETGVVGVLEAGELFIFHPDIRGEVGAYVDSVESVLPETDPAQLSQLTELVHIAAAEFSLTPVLTDPTSDVPLPPRGPIQVAPQFARLAVLKYDCTLATICLHTSPSDYGPSDLTVFSGDTSRFIALDGDWNELTQSPSVLQSHVLRLQQVCEEHPSQLVRDVAASGVIRLQGLLWCLRLTVMRQPGYLMSLKQSVDESRYEMGIG